MPASYVVDMDGVVYHGQRVIPARPSSWDGPARRAQVPLPHEQQPVTPRDLPAPGSDGSGIESRETRLTPRRRHGRLPPRPEARRDGLRDRRPRADQGPYDAGYTLTEHHPDYVVVGDTRSYDYEKIERAVR